MSEPRMNASREAVVRCVERLARHGALSTSYPTAAAIAHSLGFETVDGARTHIRYAEWAGWIERAGRDSLSRAETYRITDAGRASLSVKD